MSDPATQPAAPLAVSPAGGNKVATAPVKKKATKAKTDGAWPHPAAQQSDAKPKDKPAVKAAVKASAKPVVKAAVKATKQVTQKPSDKPVGKAAAKPAKTPVPTVAKTTTAPKPNATKPAKVQVEAANHAKVKLVRDSFTIPAPEYALFDVLKQRALAAAHPVKKSELLRAGIALLAALPDEALLKTLKDVPTIKTGRPKGKKSN